METALRTRRPEATATLEGIRLPGTGNGPVEPKHQATIAAERGARTSAQGPAVEDRRCRTRPRAATTLVRVRTDFWASALGRASLSFADL
jgi:hypothetical protein